MHNADPWAEPINTDPMATMQTPGLAEDSNFGDLLTALAGNNAVEHALPLWRAGFKTLKMAIDAGKAALMREGLSASVASAICLLYTSPSPRDVEESRMPSSA